MLRCGYYSRTRQISLKIERFCSNVGNPIHTKMQEKWHLSKIICGLRCTYPLLPSLLGSRIAMRQYYIMFL